MLSDQNNGESLEDQVVQLLSGVQRGSARLRPTASKIIDLISAREEGRTSPGEGGDGQRIIDGLGQALAGDITVRSYSMPRAVSSPPPSGEVREAVARIIWRRFSEFYRETWDDEPHKAEYLSVADAILALIPTRDEAAQHFFRHPLVPALREAIADGFSNGNEPYDDASEPQQRRYDMAVYSAIEALDKRGALRDEAALPEAVKWVHPEPERTAERIAEARAWMRKVTVVDEAALLIQRLTSRLERIDKAIKRAQSAATQAPAELPGDVVSMVKALKASRDQFARYADSHHAKRTAEGDEKAATNLSMAEMCEGALAPFADRVPLDNDGGADA